MAHNYHIYFKLTVLLSSCCIFTLITNTFAQTVSPEKPTLKDFGSSLKKFKQNTEDISNSKNQKRENSDAETIRVETNLVRADVLVIDQKGKAVLGLKANDFIVTENKIQQEIGTFSLGDSAEIPRSIVLIIDYSGSQIPYIKTSVEAAKVLVDKLNPKDRMAIVTDNVELFVQFTRDKDLLKNKLDSLNDKVKNGKFKGGEFKNGELGKNRQYSALLATLNELFDNEDIRPIVIFQTDGDEVFYIKSADPNAKSFSDETPFTEKELFDSIEKSRATIYSVISGLSFIGLSPEERMQRMRKVKEKQWGMSPPEGFWTMKSMVEDLRQKSERILFEQKSMEIVARGSGGFSGNLEKPEQADEIYSRIFSGIINRYLIGYYPNNQEHDGKRRNVQIEVRGHPEYIVWGRKTYIAPK